MNIIITSFAEVRLARRQLTMKTIVPVSIASYAPKDFTDAPSIPQLAPLDKDGARLRIRDFGTPEGFLAWMRERAYNNASIARLSLNSILKDHKADTALLCCWCPGTRTAAQQLADHGSFVCHGLAAAAGLNDSGRFAVKLSREWAKQVYWPTDWK